MRNLPGIFMPGHKKALADPKILGRAKEAPHPVRLKYGALFRHRSIHKKAPPVSTSISDVRRQHSIRQGQFKGAENCHNDQASKIWRQISPATDLSSRKGTTPWRRLSISAGLKASLRQVDKCYFSFKSSHELSFITVFLLWTSESVSEGRLNFVSKEKRNCYTVGAALAHARSAVQALPPNVRQRVEYSEPSQRSRVPQAVTPTKKLTSIHVH
jgi:hypothetical protein